MPTANEAFIAVNDKVSPWNADEVKLITFINFLASPLVSELVLTVFVILVIGVAYMIFGIVLFALFGNK